jgi:hypothetical protein
MNRYEDKALCVLRVNRWSDVMLSILSTEGEQMERSDDESLFQRG